MFLVEALQICVMAAFGVHKQGNGRLASVSIAVTTTAETGSHFFTGFTCCIPGATAIASANEVAGQNLQEPQLEEDD